MIETYLRTKIEFVLISFAKLFKKFSISANTLTILALIFGIITGTFISLKLKIFSLIFLWLSGFFDCIDGIVARITNKSCAFGAYLDLISDRLVESAIMLGFSTAYPQFNILYLIFMIALLFHFSTFVVAGALFKNNGPKSMHYDKSIIERVDAFIIFSFMIIFPAHINWFLIPLNTTIFFSATARFFRVQNWSKELN